MKWVEEREKGGEYLACRISLFHKNQTHRILWFFITNLILSPPLQSVINMNLEWLSLKRNADLQIELLSITSLGCFIKFFLSGCNSIPNHSLRQNVKSFSTWITILRVNNIFYFHFPFKSRDDGYQMNSRILMSFVLTLKLESQTKMSNYTHNSPILVKLYTLFHISAICKNAAAVRNQNNSEIFFSLNSSFLIVRSIK